MARQHQSSLEHCLQTDTSRRALSIVCSAKHLPFCVRMIASIDLQASLSSKQPTTLHRGRSQHMHAWIFTEWKNAHCLRSCMNRIASDWSHSKPPSKVLPPHSRQAPILQRPYTAWSVPMNFAAWHASHTRQYSLQLFDPIAR